MKASKQRNAFATLTFFFAFAIVGMLNYLSYRHYKRFDWSSEQIFTLSQRTKQILSELEQDVSVYLFFALGEADFANVNDLIEEYRALSEHIVVHHIDPDRNRAEYALHAQKFGLSATENQGEWFSQVPIVVTSGEKRWKIERDDLLAADVHSYDAEGGPQLKVQSERALSGAILEVTNKESTRVCLSRGHGEWALDSTSTRDFGRAKEELEWAKIQVDTIEILGAQEISSTCDALFVLGPQRAFTRTETNAIATYLSKGGSALFALDPVLAKKGIQKTGLKAIMDTLGIVIGMDLIVELDKARLLSTNPIDAFIVTNFGEHVLTTELSARGGGVVFAVGRSLAILEGSRAHKIALTTAESFATQRLRQLETAKEIKAHAKDTLGPVTIGLAWEAESPSTSRIVTLGDSDWLQAALLDEPGFANLDLLNAITAWLTKRQALIEIAPRKTQARAVIMTEDDLLNVTFRVVILMPLAMLILAFGTWWTRRS